jgi:hypothetical protein
MVPPTLAARHGRSITFLGNLHAQNSATFAEMSALWAAAYLGDMFPSCEITRLLDNLEEMERESEYVF